MFTLSERAAGWRITCRVEQRRSARIPSPRFPGCSALAACAADVECTPRSGADQWSERSWAMTTWREDQDDGVGCWHPGWLPSGACWSRMSWSTP